MSTEIATWYEVKFEGNGENFHHSHTLLGTGTTLNFAGVEAGTQSVIKCIRIRFSKPIYGLKFWVVNNISGNTSDGGVFDDGWSHGYHIRDGKNQSENTGETTIEYNSPLLDANNPNLFNSEYYTSSNANENMGKKVPFGYELNAGEGGVDDPSSVGNYNSFVPIPQNTKIFTANPEYYQWGHFNKNGNFGKTDGTSNIPSTEEELQKNEDGWVTPYIYLVVNPPVSADGGARTGWGYRISFLYS